MLILKETFPDNNIGWEFDNGVIVTTNNTNGFYVAKGNESLGELLGYVEAKKDFNEKVAVLDSGIDPVTAEWTITSIIM